MGESSLSLSNLGDAHPSTMIRLVVVVQLDRVNDWPFGGICIWEAACFRHALP